MKMIWLHPLFNVRIISKSPAEFSPPIGAFIELRSNTTLQCLVSLAPNTLRNINKQKNELMNERMN